MLKPGKCSVCGRALDKPAAMLLGRGDRPTMVLCETCMLADPRSMVAVDDDADTDPIDVGEWSDGDVKREVAPWPDERGVMRRWVAPAIAFAVALLSRCLAH